MIKEDHSLACTTRDVSETQSRPDAIATPGTKEQNLVPRENNGPEPFGFRPDPYRYTGTFGLTPSRLFPTIHLSKN